MIEGQYMAKTTEGNGSRNIWELVRLLTVIILAGLAAVAGYGQLKERLQQNTEDDAKVHPAVMQNTITLAEVKKDIGQIQKDVMRVDTKLDTQAKTQEEVLRIQQQILREVQSQ